MTEEALSDFWRRRQSNNLSEELANVLNGARGYVGFFGSDFSVNWGRDSSVSTKSEDILLDYSPLKDKAPPFNGQDIDLVMGSAIHECGHIKWSYPSGDVRSYYAKKRGHYVPKRGYGAGGYPYLSHEEDKEASELHTVANIIEDFYVENKISETYPTLGAYLRESRKLSADKELPHNLYYDLSTGNPTFDSVLTMWGAIALIDKEIPKDASAQSKNLLNKLINYTISTVRQRPQKRLQTAYKIWEELNALERASDRERQRQIDKMKQEREEQEQSTDDGASPDEGEGHGDEQKPTGEVDKADKEKEEKKETEKESGTKEETSRDSGEDTSDKAQGEPEVEEDTGEDTGNDRKMESKEITEEVGEDEEESPEIEEDLDEPYQDHIQLRECYSINPDDKEFMPRNLVDAVDEYEEKKPEDITQQVNQLLGGAGGKEIVMELAPGNPARAQKLFLETRRTAQKVSQLFMQDKRLRTRYRRGLQEGVVDPRRLHKAGASDYKLFERKEILSTPSLAVGVLVDASGSMTWGGLGGAKINQAVSTAMALKTALTMIEGVDLMIMAYNTSQTNYLESRDTTLHRIYDRKTGEFRPDVKADGGTPSGYAIAGIVSQIGRYLKGKDKLIIHITDGAPDSHETVKQAVDYCLLNKIEVMTLTMAQFSDEVKESYHGLCEYLDDIDKLPDAIASLLKKRLEKRILRVK